MKRIISVILALFTALCLCACENTANMGTLTEYQNGDFTAEVKFFIEGEEYAGTIERREGALVLRVSVPQALGAFTFTLTENGTEISTGDMSLLVKNAELLKFSRLFPLFSLPISDTWKIKRSRPGGVDVYVCENENVTLYVDATSHLPLKIVSGGAEVDIISFRLGE